MAFAPLIVMAVAAVASAAATYASAKQQSETNKYNAKVYENEALTQKYAAKYEEKKHRERVRRFIGIQRAKYAASGIDISAGGSAQMVISDTAGQGEMDALAIRYGGDVAAIGARNKATLQKFLGKSTMAAGYLETGATLLSSASNMYGMQLKTG